MEVSLLSRPMFAATVSLRGSLISPAHSLRLMACTCTLGCDGQDRWVTEEASTKAAVGSITKCRRDRYFASRPVGGGRWAGLIVSLLLHQDFYGLVKTFCRLHTLFFNKRDISELHSHSSRHVTNSYSHKLVAFAVQRLSSLLPAGSHTFSSSE